MNSPPPLTDDERSEYLQLVLRLDPAADAEEIIAIRRTYFGIPAMRLEDVDGNRSDRGNVSAQSLALRRAAAARMVGNMRENFRMLQPQEIFKKLDGLELPYFPDLQLAVARLMILAKNAAAMSELSHVVGVDAECYERLWAILLAPPADVSRLKGRFSSWLKDPAVRGRAQQTVDLLWVIAPDVYDLERYWLESLLNSQVIPVRHWKRDSSKPNLAEMLIVAIVVLVIGYLWVANV